MAPICRGHPLQWRLHSDVASYNYFNKPTEIKKKRRRKRGAGWSCCNSRWVWDGRANYLSRGRVRAEGASSAPALPCRPIGSKKKGCEISCFLSCRRSCVSPMRRRCVLESKQTYENVIISKTNTKKVEQISRTCQVNCYVFGIRRPFRVEPPWKSEI